MGKDSIRPQKLLIYPGSNSINLKSEISRSDKISVTRNLPFNYSIFAILLPTNTARYVSYNISLYPFLYSTLLILLEGQFLVH